MVNYMMISAELENLTDLQPQDGSDDANFGYYFKLKCGNCGEVTQKETCVRLNETVSSMKGKGETHLAQKCKFCSREGTVTMIGGRGRPLTQLVDFVFGSGWKVESIEGTKFTDVDLSGGEFVEYDDKGECPVMISNLSATFTVVK